MPRAGAPLDRAPHLLSDLAPPLARRAVILPVPANYPKMARELAVGIPRDVGLGQLTLKAHG